VAETTNISRGDGIDLKLSLCCHYWITCLL